MKMTKTLLDALSIILVVTFACSTTLAQSNTLPTELNQSAKLPEILDWLDNNGLARARVGLDTGYETAIFSQGFKLAKVDGCQLTLRNDDVKLLSFATAAFEPEDTTLTSFRIKVDDLTPYPAELYIKLDVFNPKKGKRPHLFTKDPARAQVFGSWRTEFEVRGGRIANRNLPIIIIYNSAFGNGQEHMYGSGITFTFDSKDMSEKFDAAFRQAIGLCTSK